MPRGIDSLLILVFLSHTSSFPLGVDSRHVRTSENSDENSGRTGGGSQEFALSGRENVTHRRDNEETAGLSGISENFINCTRIFKTLEAHDNETQIRGANIPIAKFDRLTRAKRGTTSYRDNTEVDTNRDAAVQTGNEESVPAGGTHESGVPDDVDNSNADAGTDTKEDPDQVDEDIEKDGDAKLEEDKNVNQLDTVKEPNGVDETVSYDEDPKENENSENETEQEDYEKIPENETDQSVDGDEDGGEEEYEGDGYEGDSEYGDTEESIIDLDMVIEWGLGLTVEDIWNFIVNIEDIIALAGDYILSLLLRELKRELSRTGMHDKFKVKFEQLVASPDLDRSQAMEKLMKAIRKQFGRTYEKQIVRFLKDLCKGFRP